MILRLIVGYLGDLGWVILGTASIVFAALAATTALRRWSGGIYVSPARKVGPTLIALLASSIFAALWFAFELMVGRPVTVLSISLWGDEIWDFDIVVMNAVLGLILSFLLIPGTYWLVTAHATSNMVLRASLPIIAISILLLVTVIRHTTATAFQYPSAALITLVALTIVWLPYTFVLDRLGAPP